LKKNPADGGKLQKSTLKMRSIKGMTTAARLSARIPSRLSSRQAIRESAHWAASGVFHPDAAQRAPVLVSLGARLSLSVSSTRP